MNLVNFGFPLMHQQDASNIYFELASDFIRNTDASLFLTGKAGTGKTSFLKFISEHCDKNKIILAPTGVAAMNAGGVTIHSFFQLPRGLFIPGPMQNAAPPHLEINTPQSMFRNIRFSAAKRELLEELELMIIDEVSMVRADLLDAIDILLRHFRNRPSLPFGGVQVLFIGDLFQLPPVVRGEEWSILQEFYKSPFFFSAKAIESQPPVYIELQKVYRQNEQSFIEILNRIREQKVTATDLEFLHQRFQPGFQSSAEDHYITITTHNRQADELNEKALNRLPGNLVRFAADIEGDFPDRSYPADLDLKLKPGAQVMFIKNDNKPERRYYNGKIATVASLSNDEIKVYFGDDSSETLLVEKESWKNIRYNLNRENNSIEEEELGSFAQYPLRLAWAVTVHKSQGLSFQKAVIDVGASFAAGQVYVALSRCTSLAGMVLRSRIPSSAIITDHRILEFTHENEMDLDHLHQILSEKRDQYQSSVLMNLFQFEKIRKAILRWNEFVQEKEGPHQAERLQLLRGLSVQLDELQLTGKKFQVQLKQLLGQALIESQFNLVNERIVKAIQFFGNEFVHKLLAPLQEHRKQSRLLSKGGKYVQVISEVEATIWSQIQKLVHARFHPMPAFVDPDLFKEFDPAKQEKKSIAPSKKGAGPKIPSSSISLELFKEGKSVSEIAALRSLSTTTVESHLAGYIASGEVKAEQLIASEDLQTILKLLETGGGGSVGSLKFQLPDSISFFAIRVAIEHFRTLQKT